MNDLRVIMNNLTEPNLFFRILEMLIHVADTLNKSDHSSVTQ